MKALAIREQIDADSDEAARSRDNLVMLYLEMKKPEAAEPLCRKALEIHNRRFGPSDPETINSLKNLALVCRAMGNTAEAVELEDRAKAVEATGTTTVSQ